MYDFVNKNIDRLYGLISEVAFMKFDTASLSLSQKEQIYRKVIFIRENLEQCKEIFKEISEF